MFDGGFSTMTEIDTNQLWSASAGARLAAARALSEPALSEVRARLRTGLPTADWPYGFATSINPLLVTLGISPGSARSWKGRDPAKEPFAAPTAGQPHPHLTAMRRATPFGERIRCLARTILKVGDLTDEDAYALFGNVVLDPGRSGAARDVQIDPEFAGWVLRSIRDQLRPRHLVCIGMKGHRDAARLLEQTFDGFVRARPHRAHRFHSYKRSDLTFLEWDVNGPNGNKTTIVFWPHTPPPGALQPVRHLAGGLQRIRGAAWCQHSPLVLVRGLSAPARALPPPA